MTGEKKLKRDRYAKFINEDIQLLRDIGFTVSEMKGSTTISAGFKINNRVLVWPTVKKARINKGGVTITYDDISELIKII